MAATERPKASVCMSRPSYIASGSGSREMTNFTQTRVRAIVGRRSDEVDGNHDLPRVPIVLEQDHQQQEGDTDRTGGDHNLYPPERAGEPLSESGGNSDEDGDRDDSSKENSSKFVLGPLIASPDLEEHNTCSRAHGGGDQVGEELIVVPLAPLPVRHAISKECLHGAREDSVGKPPDDGRAEEKLVLLVCSHCVARPDSIDGQGDGCKIGKASHCDDAMPRALVGDPSHWQRECQGRCSQHSFHNALSMIGVKGAWRTG
eukprot:752741-Hanusia_phi.AAC.2